VEVKRFDVWLVNVARQLGQVSAKVQQPTLAVLVEMFAE